MKLSGINGALIAKGKVIGYIVAIATLSMLLIVSLVGLLLVLLRRRSKQNTLHLETDRGDNHRNRNSTSLSEANKQATAYDIVSFNDIYMDPTESGGRNDIHMDPTKSGRHNELHTEYHLVADEYSEHEQDVYQQLNHSKQQEDHTYTTISVPHEQQEDHAYATISVPHEQQDHTL